MSEQELQAIRERSAKLFFGRFECDDMQEAWRLDLVALLAEVDRLRKFEAAVESMRQRLRMCADAHLGLTPSRVVEEVEWLDRAFAGKAYPGCLSDPKPSEGSG